MGALAEHGPEPPRAPYDPSGTQLVGATECPAPSPSSQASPSPAHVPAVPGAGRCGSRGNVVVRVESGVGELWLPAELPDPAAVVSVRTGGVGIA